MNQLNDEAYQALHGWVHENYGKASGLMSHEYIIIQDANITHDYELEAGPKIKIGTKYMFWDERFKRAMAHAFANPYIKKMIRGTALVRASDAVKFYRSAFSGMELIPTATEKARMHKYVTRIHTTVEVMDVRTKRAAEVDVINCDAFTAQEMALKILYQD